MPVALRHGRDVGRRVGDIAAAQSLLAATPDQLTGDGATARPPRSWRVVADEIYLFNYMDSQTAMDDLDNYPALLREVGSLPTMDGKPRRHVLTFADTWAPGEAARAYPLPAALSADGWGAFRLHIGPAPRVGRAVVCLDIDEPLTPEVRVNGRAMRGHEYAGEHH